MKTNILTRILALAMSALFASVATVGVAIVMTSSGEHARTEFNVNAAAQTGQPAAPKLTRWQTSASQTKRVL